MTTTRLIAITFVASTLMFAAGWLTSPDTITQDSEATSETPNTRRPSTGAPRNQAFLASLDFPADTPLYQGYLRLAEINNITSIPELRSRFFALKDSKHRSLNRIEHVRALIFSRLATLSPKAALSLARDATEHHYYARASYFSPAFPGIADQPSSSFFSTIIRDKEISVSQAAAYLKQLTRGDIAPVIESLRSAGHAGLADDLQRNFITDLAKSDATQAFAEIEKLPANQRDRATYSLYQEWANVDPASAWDSAVNNPAFDSNSSTLSKILVSWMKTNPSRAIAKLDTSTIKRLGYNTRDVTDAYAVNSPAAALHWVKTHAAAFDKKQQGYLYQGLLNGLAAADPAAAINLLAQNHSGSGPDMNDLVGPFAGHYVRNDANATLAWIDTLDPKQRGIATTSVIDYLDYKDPDRTFELLADPSLPTDAFVSAIKNSAASLAKNDFGRFLETAALAPAEELPEILAYSLRELSRAGEIDNALAIIETVGHDDEHITSQTQHLVSEWTKTDPAASSGWVENLPEGELRDYAYRNLIDAWIRISPADATTWLDAQPASKARDRAAGAAAERLVTYDKPAALVWLATIENDSIRNSAISAAAPSLTHQDLKTLHAGNLITDHNFERYAKKLDSESALLNHLRSPR